MVNSNLIVTITFDNNIYTIISSHNFSGSQELIINSNIYYSLTQDNIDLLLQETSTNMFIITDTFAINRLNRELKSLSNITLLNANLLFMSKSDVIFKKFNEEEIKLRIDKLSDNIEESSDLIDILPYIHNSIDRFSYTGSNRDYTRYSISKDLTKLLKDKPIINPQSLSLYRYDKPINIYDNDFNKLSYLIDIYEGVIGIRNLVLDSEIINRLNIFKNLEDEYLYVPFTFLRYIFYKFNVTNIEFEPKVIFGTKMYIDYRDIFDIADLRTYNPITRIYIDFYQFLTAIEVFDGNLITCDLLSSDFYVSNSVDSDYFIKINS
jgi:hypothetical protein